MSGSFLPKSLDLHPAEGELDSESFAVQRLSTRWRKKLIASASLDADSVAIASFLDANKRCSEPLDVDETFLGECREFIVHSLESFTSKHRSGGVQESLSMSLLIDLWRFGPGASNGTKGTHFADKIFSVWTCTSRAIPFVQLLQRSLPPVRAQVGPKQWDMLSIVEGSRTQPVPKNEETSRLICIEPLGNMALQLAAGSYIEGALRLVGLKISSSDPVSLSPEDVKLKNVPPDFFLNNGRTQQNINREMARLGSIDGSLATLDLKSASDLIRPSLIKAIWPRAWFELFDIIRSPSTVLKQDKNEETLELNMMSTMGNGFTFPMMTLTFAAICYATERLRNKSQPRLRFPSGYSVFGDDIICPIDAYGELSAYLTACGFIVNLDKSFSTGFFRESCGGDFYRGVDVTPFYIKSVQKPEEIYVAINQALSWSVEHRGHVLWNLLEKLVSALPDKPFCVPEWEDPSSGILCMDVGRHYHLLAPDRIYKKMRISHPFLRLWMLVSGYVIPFGNSLYYLPRPHLGKQCYSVKRKRLPKGWLGGRWPFMWPDDKAKFRQQIVDILCHRS